MFGVCGTGFGAISTVSYQVSAGNDDGYAWSATEQDVGSGYLMIGDGVYSAPYHISGMRFAGFGIPRSASIVSANLVINSGADENRGQIYGVIEAEAVDDALDFGSRYIAAAVKGFASVDWDHKFAWDPDTQYSSPDITDVVQEVVSRGDWSSGNSLALFYSTRMDSSKSRGFSSFEGGAGAIVEISYETYTISGHVTMADGNGLLGVGVSAGADIEGAVTDGSGYYELLVPPGWSGTVTVAKSDWGFSPSSRVYSSVSSDALSEDYSAIQPVISGYVTDGVGTGIDGVSVVSDNGGGSDTTDATGFYAITVPYGWTGIVTPSKAGWGCEPLSRTYSVGVVADTPGQDYTMIQPRISGYVRDGGGSGISGVAVNADIGGGSDTTDATGYYEIVVPYGWSGTIIPSKSGWDIIPLSWSYSNVVSDQPNQDYTGFQPKISGYVRDANGVDVQGVSVSADNGGGSYTTDANGYYEITVPYDWTGTVTPLKTGWGFTPWSQGYSNVTSTLVNQDFEAFELLFTDIEAGFWGLTGSPAWGDYDNDGDLDLAICGTWHDGTWMEMAKIYRNDGGTFTDISAPLQGVKGTLAWADYDNDGDLDLALTGYMGGGHWLIHVYRNDNHDQFVLAANLDEAEGHSISWGDYDNDGDIDLAVSGSWWHRVYQPFTIIYRNDGGNIFTDSGANVVDAQSSTLAWGDYDNDGDLDLALVGESTSGYVGTIYRNDDGELVDASAGIEAIAGSLAWSDYDNDGDLDLGISGTNGTGDVTKLYRNDGESGFTDIGAFSTVLSGGLSWADYDSDGDSDLIIAGTNGVTHSVKIYRNDGGGVFVEEDDYLPEVSGNISWGDFDNDDDLDFAILGESAEGRISRIYRNGGHVFNAAPSAPGGLWSSRDSNTITFTWNAASDSETPIDGLSYNLRVGTAPGLDDVFSAMADLSTGLRRVPALGNAQKQLSWSLTGLGSAPLYYWSIQSIDSCYAGSPWSQEQTVLPLAGIEVTPPILNFEALLDWPNPDSQTLSISNSLFGTLNWTIAPDVGCDWIIADPNSGTSTGEIDTVSVGLDISTLSAGTHNCMLIVSDPNSDNSPQSVEVNLNLIGPILFVSPNDCNFSAQKGEAAPPGQILSVQNNGGGSLNWEITVPPDCNWLNVDPLSGQTDSNEANEVTLNINATDLGGGSYSCDLIVSDPNAEDSPQMVHVSLRVDGPLISLSSAEFEFHGALDGNNPPEQILSISNTGFGVLDWTISIPNDCNWISAEPNTGQSSGGPNEVVLNVDTNGLGHGYHECTLAVSDPMAENNPQYVEVVLAVSVGEIFVPTDFNTIQAAVDWAVDGDEVVLLPGRYVGEGNFDVVIGGKAITVRSFDPNDPEVVASTIVDGNNVMCYYEWPYCDHGYDETGFGFIFEDGEGADSVVDGLTIIGSGWGGGVFILEGCPTIRKCVIRDNRGNGILASVTGEMTISDCTIKWNFPGEMGGGGIYLFGHGDGSVIINNCVINNHWGYGGGGIISNWRNEGGSALSISIYDSVISENETLDGGGINISDGNCVIVGCVIRDNSAMELGGGVYFGNDVNVSISDSIISDNSAGTDGGGGYFGDYDIVEITKSNVLGNSAGESGGGLYFDGHIDSTITGCRISDNHATWAGGGIKYGGPYFQTIENCIISGNVADNGGAVRDSFGTIRNSTIVGNRSYYTFGSRSGTRISNSIVWDNLTDHGELFRPDPCYTCVEVDHNGVGNIDVDPCFAIPGYWHPNDTPIDANDDYWVEGDYHLKSEAGRWEPSIYSKIDQGGDGVINLREYAVLAREWQKKGGFLAGDLDYSGVVDGNDLAILLDGYMSGFVEGQWELDDVSSLCIDAGDPNSDWTEELLPHGERINMGAYGGTSEASKSQN
ncbi:MAG: FG-GAP-like repeat-containing protein [Planctomycetota bacterium]